MEWLIALLIAVWLLLVSVNYLVMRRQFKRDMAGHVYTCSDRKALLFISFIGGPVILAIFLLVWLLESADDSPANW